MSIRSDYNTSGVHADIVARPVLFSDLPLAFTIHPVHNDIRPITDIAAIQQSVKNLVLTNYYEIPFHPEIGSNVAGLLFENADPFTAEAIKTEIRAVLEKYEPRVRVGAIKVKDESEQNAYQVDITFIILATERVVNIDFYLHRQR